MGCGRKNIPVATSRSLGDLAGKKTRGHFHTAARLLFARVVSVTRRLVRRRHRLVRRRRFAYPVAGIAPAKVNSEDKTARRGPLRRPRPRQPGLQPEAR